MFDIIFLGEKNKRWTELKSRFPQLKHAADYEKISKQVFTKMYWLVHDDIKVLEDFKFDYEVPEWDQQYTHVFLNDNNYNGIALVPRKKRISKNEIEHRFFVDCKDIEIKASITPPYDVFQVDSYEDYKRALATTSTEMFWIHKRSMEVLPEFDLEMRLADDYDLNITHVFNHSDEEGWGLMLCSVHSSLSKREIEHWFPVNHKEWDLVSCKTKPYDIFQVDSYEDYKHALEESSTEMFWATSCDIELLNTAPLDMTFTDEQDYDINSNHAFLHNGENYQGLLLCSKHVPLTEKEIGYRHPVHRKEWNIPSSIDKPYDIVFISYNEPDADKNYEHLLTIAPHAKRVHGVTGIHKAHIEAAKLCKTSMFWAIDGDALIKDDFNFLTRVPVWEYKSVHVWRSENPVNDLTYGYGGVKLLPRELVLNVDVNSSDMTTSISDSFIVHYEVSNVTGFNTDPFSTWRSAFRECVKLASHSIDRQKVDETEYRLSVWQTIGADRAFGKYCIDGAKKGAEYGKLHADNPEALRMINNFDWLHEEFLKYES